MGGKEKEKMTTHCTICHDTYTDPFIADFQNGICLPCQAQQWHDEWERDVEKELVKLNAKLGTSYDFDAFCYECWMTPGLLVAGLSESETPILYEVYLRELENVEEYYGVKKQLRLL